MSLSKQIQILTDSDEILINSKAYQYALSCVDEENVNVGKYVKKQCREFLNCINSEKYYIDKKSFVAIGKLMKHIYIMPNKSAYEHLTGFQWFFIINVFCVKRWINNKNRYELSVLLIARKNGRRKPAEKLYSLLSFFYYKCYCRHSEARCILSHQTGSFHHRYLKNW